MTAPAADIDIANMALDYLGLPPAESIDAPTTNTENVLSRHYDEVRRSILREASWNFAKCRTAVNRNGTPPFDYCDSYGMPADFIRLLTINEFNVFDVGGQCNPDRSYCGQPLLWWQQYDFSQGNLLINAEGAPTLQIRYVQDVTDVTKWDSEFPGVVAIELAVKCCVTLTNDRKLLQLLKAESGEVKSMALAVGGQEAKPRRIQRSRALEARRGAGGFGTSILGGTYFYWGP